MYTLHIGNKNYSSWSLRPWILLAERGIPFEEKLHVFGPAFKVKEQGQSPTGKVPSLHHDGRIVWDSLAIAEYLAERHASIWPSGEDARAWARCAAAEMHSGFQALRSDRPMNCGIRVRPRTTSEALARDIARLGALWTEGLQRFGGPFLAGASFGAVDAFYCPVAFRVQSYGIALPPAAADYAKRLLALPAMRKWYEAALREPWRDEPHEAEIAQAGEVLEDLRIRTATA
jgi:glutathione S-transferase